MKMRKAIWAVVAAGLMGAVQAVSSVPYDVRNIALDSVEWQTAHAGTLQLPVDYPAGAASAVLTVTNRVAGTAAETLAVPARATSVEWTAFTGVAPKEDAVYDLRLDFYKEGASSPFTNYVARVAMAKGAFGDAVSAFGTHAARGWRNAQKQMVFHVDARWQAASAAANAATVTVAQATREVKQTLGASGWFGAAFSVPPWTRGDDVSVTADFADCEAQLAAAVVFPVQGMALILR